jgi:hypothetical protein
MCSIVLVLSSSFPHKLNEHILKGCGQGWNSDASYGLAVLSDCGVWLLGMGFGQLALRWVLVQLAEVVRGAGGQPFVWHAVTMSWPLYPAT